MNFILNFCNLVILCFEKITSLQSSISPRNQSQIHWFFILWISLQALFHKILFSPISIIDSLSDLIQFKEIIRNFPTSMWIWPIFTIIPLNLWIILKIGKFGLFFDTRPCVFNDLAVLSREQTCQNTNYSNIFSTHKVLFMSILKGYTTDEEPEKFNMSKHALQ